MSEKRCDGCKHWSANEHDWEAESVGFCECLAVRERWRITDEASKNLERDDDPEGAFARARRDALRASRAYVQDGSEYKAELLTAPDFFCALFTPKGAN